MPRKKITPPKLGNRETHYRITKRIGTVGTRAFNVKLQVSSGTDDPKTWQECINAIDYLIDRGRDDLIDDLIQRRRTPLELRTIHRGAKDNEIPHIRSTHALKDALDTWLPTARNRHNGNPLSPSTVEGYQNSINAIMRFAEPNDTVRELGAVFTRLRDYYLSPPTRYQPRQPANAKIMLLAFIRATEGEDSALYRQISKIKTGVYVPVIPTKLTLADAAFIRDQLPPAAAAIWWGCCMTGFRFPGEYLDTPWQVEGNTVVLSADHLGKGRIIPCLDANITAPELSINRYRIHFRRMTKRLKIPTIKPYHGRDVFQQMITATHIDPYRMRQYLGRSEDFATQQGYSKSDTHYQRHEITPALREQDRKDLLAYMRKELKKKPTLKLPDDE